MAVGPDGVVTTVVGVGTGGCADVGAADPETEADGVPRVGTVLTGAPERTDSTMDTRFGVRGTPPPTVPGAALATGALPSTPAPPGALTGGGAVSAAPSAHPAATANGSPRVTRPRKTVLGVRRTPEHRTSAAKGYGGVGYRRSIAHPPA